MKSPGRMTFAAILACILSVSILMVACVKEATLSLDNLVSSGTVSNQTESGADIHLGAESGTASITVSSNKPWTAEVINTRADGWLVLSANSGKGGETLTVKVSENTDYSERSASIVIKCEDKARTIRVTQKQKEAVILSSSRVSATAEGGTFAVEVKYNVEYSVTVDDKCSGWIHKLDTKALSSGSISFTVDPNDEITKREGKLHVSSSKGEEVITVYQDAATPAMILSQSEYTVSDKGGVIEVAVASNVDVSFAIGASWIKEVVTKSMSTDTYTFEILPNEGVESRSATIVFKGKYNVLTETVTVNQVQKDAIVIAKPSYEIGYEGGLIELEVGHNIDFEVRTDQEWLRQVTTKAYTVETLIFEALPCDSPKNREATITISSKDGSITQSIKVYQVAILTLSSEVFYLKQAGGSFQLDISSNCGIEVINPAVDWLHELQTTGSNGVTKTYYVDSNPSSKTRTAEIIVRGTSSEISKTVKVVQYPEPKVKIDKSEIFVSYEGGSFDLAIDHNVPIVMECASPWFRLVGTEDVSETNTIYHFFADPNEGEDPKFDWILVFYEDALYGSLVVNQGTKAGDLPRLQYFTDLPYSSITAVNFIANSSKTTSICYAAGENSIYGETVGTTVNLYTSADRFKVKTIDKYFIGCENIKTLDLSSWDTSDCQYMYGLFMYCRSLESVNLSSFDTRQVVDMGYMFYDCLSLKELDLSSFKTPNLVNVHDMFSGTTGNMTLEHLDLSGFDTSRITDAGYMLQLCTDLKSLDLRGWEKIPETANLQGLLFLVGELAEECKLYCDLSFAERLLDGGASVGKNVGFVLNDGKSLYQSTDYSADGRVTLLQKATEGNGVNLVFMGDGYSDRNIESGKYRKDIERSVEFIFSHEPYKSLRNMFNIYEVAVVSPSEHFYRGGATAFGCTTDVPLEFDSGKIREYAGKSLPTVNIDAITTIVLMNIKDSPGTAVMHSPTVWDDSKDYASGYSIAVCGLGEDDTAGMEVLMHELGHAFSKLDEEYVKVDEAISPQLIASRREDAKHGWWDNIDFTSDLTEIKWSTFVYDSRYAWEGIGAYEGAGSYAYGVWRPTESSFMKYNIPPYNAPSRASIYRRIHKLAYGEEWEFDMEAFKVWDLSRSASPAMSTTAAPSMHKEMPAITPRQHVQDYRVIRR